MSDDDTAQRSIPRQRVPTLTNRSVEARQVEVQDQRGHGEVDTEVSSADQQVFFSAAVQMYVQHDCDDARVMLFDGGRDIQIKLCRQLSLAHEAATKLLSRAIGEYNSVEAARLANAACRLMSTFQEGAVVLRNVQVGSEARITVLQEVNVSGGNAVVGASVRTGAAGTPGSRDEQEK